MPFQPRCTPQTEPTDPGSPRTLHGEVLFDLLSRRALLIALTLGVVSYSTGHALMALAAGSLAEALSPTPLGRRFFGIPMLMHLGGSPAAATYVGLAAALVKASAGA